MAGPARFVYNAPTRMAIEIREHKPGKDVRDFIDAGFEVFRSDPMWVPPLDFEFKERLSPKHNPFFNRAEVALFTAWKDEKLAGRCSATIDREHIKLWKDDTGFFGFFDTIDDHDVAHSAHDAAEAWLKAPRHEAHDWPALALRQRRDRLPDRRLRLPAQPPDGALARYQAKLIEGCGLREGEGPPLLEIPRQPAISRPRDQGMGDTSRPYPR